MTKKGAKTTQDDWDFDNAELVTPKKKPSRVVFSVQFSREEFETISQRAAEAGMKPGAYIRETVLNCDAMSKQRMVAMGGSRDSQTQITFSGGMAAIFTEPTDQFEDSLFSHQDLTATR